MSETSQTENAQPEGDASPPEESGEPRRGFFVQFLAGALGAIVGAVPAVFGGLFFLDPLFRDRNPEPGPEPAEGEEPDGVVKRDGFIRMAVGADGLEDNGPPQRYTVFDDIIDAWNKFPNQPIGSVWLRKIEGQIIAFNTICPHLGCAIEHRTAENDFYCPCHTSAFDLDGKKKNPIPPRDMDDLQIKVEGDEDWIKPGEIWLKYENFRAATSEKVTV